MPDPQSYRWPTKLKKFGITDPFQRLVVAKYEREIPWQVVVDDSQSLDAYLRAHMLPRLLERVDYPPCKDVKHHYVSARQVDLDLALATDPKLDATDKGVIELIREEDGEEAAVIALLELINGRKAEAFREWVDVCFRKYAGSPAFQYLLLRSVFDLSGPGTRRPLGAPVAEDIAWLHERLASGHVGPDQNLARLYCWRVGAKGQPVPANGWQCIAQGTENATRLAAACRGTGWCVAREDVAASFLENSNFYLLRHDDRPVVAVRYLVRTGRVIECIGRQNLPPADWFVEVHLFLESQGLQWDEVAREAEAALRRVGGLESQTCQWWRERVRIWPLAIELAPEEIRRQLSAEVSPDEPTSYIDFPAFETPVGRMSQDQAVHHWQKLLEARLDRWHSCPEAVLERPRTRAIIIEAAMERLSAKDTSLRDLVDLPRFVKTEPAFREAVKERLWEVLQRELRAQQQFRRDLGSWERLNDGLPETEAEPSKLAIERAVNLLLNDDTGLFGASGFPSRWRRRPIGLDTLPELRWWQALQIDPALRFILPPVPAREQPFRPWRGRTGGSTLGDTSIGSRHDDTGCLFAGPECAF